ncbi:MAG: hypothetical protein EAZ30_12405 [Betaproteobacteria bacterium]|nr:MAG: hypothetical protein EAZ30_12405 [Betaproteobacteria bacterium]
MRTATKLITSIFELESIDSSLWNFANTLVIAYCGSSWASAEPTLTALRAKLPQAVLVGTSTAGHFGAAPDIYDEPIMLQFIGFAFGEIRAVSAQMPAISSAAELASSLSQRLAGPSLRGLLILTDGSQMDGAAFISSVAASLGEQVAVAGGMAGDGDRFASTWVWDGAQRIEFGAVMIGFYGQARMRCASGSGWTSFGVDRDITGANGAVLTELDGRSALSLYREYLGERADELPASALLFPLLVTSEKSAEPVVRTILGIDADAGSIRLAGTVSVGSKARLMRANPNRLIEAAGAAATGALAAFDAPCDEPKARAAIIVNCVGRRLILRQRAEEEIEIAIAHLGEETSIGGFYSYGEFGPSGLTACALHNQTFTIALFGEDDAVSSPS